MILVSISLSHMVKYDPVIILLSLFFSYIVVSQILSLYGSIALVNLGRFFSFLSIESAGLLGQGPAHRKAATYKQNKRMPRVEFELTIQVFERTKTVHALGHAATMMGSFAD
jgi:hypothetical protein